MCKEPSELVPNVVSKYNKVSAKRCFTFFCANETMWSSASFKSPHTERITLRENLLLSLNKFITSDRGIEIPDDFNSSTIMPWACSMHLSQMCASMPAIKTAVSAFLRPQKEHSKLAQELDKIGYKEFQKAI